MIYPCLILFNQFLEKYVDHVLAKVGGGGGGYYETRSDSKYVLYLI